MDVPVNPVQTAPQGFRQLIKHILCQPLRLAARTTAATLGDEFLLLNPSGKTSGFSNKKFGCLKKRKRLLIEGRERFSRRRRKKITAVFFPV
ncbi:MAG: hypothetical protein KKH22_00045 [Proteobacteria bacterium]|nr:hypothetical protein [Pseudomonadota bacterium]